MGDGKAQKFIYWDSALGDNYGSLNLVIYKVQPIVLDDSEYGECDGKVTELTLRYLGETAVQVEVIHDKKKKAITIFDEVVEPNEEFTLYGADKKGTLGPKIQVFVDGELNTGIHTSCSYPIGPGLIVGDFVVVSGYSRNGGLLPPVGENDDDENGDVTEDTTPVSNSNSLRFDGDGDYVEVPDANILSPLNFTIELWVKQPELTSGRNTYIHKDRGGSHVEYNLMENVNPSGLYSYAGYGLFESSAHPSANEWSHIAATFDSEADLIEVFLNGVSLGTKTITDEIINTDGNLYIGLNPPDPSYNALTGMVDEVHISNVVRYRSDFTPPLTQFEPDSNTIALYHFNEELEMSSSMQAETEMME